MFSKFGVGFHNLGTSSLSGCILQAQEPEGRIVPFEAEAVPKKSGKKGYTCALCDAKSKERRSLTFGVQTEQTIHTYKYIDTYNHIYTYIMYI